jgi:hypothetical protein
MQIFKNSGAREVIVSSVQTKLHGSVSRQTNWAESGLALITFGNWEIVYAYQPDGRAVSIAQFGILLDKFGSVM